MIDTVEGYCQGAAVGAAELRAFRAIVPGRLDMASVADAGDVTGQVNRWSGHVPGLGRLTLNRDGSTRFSGSLMKFRQRIVEGRAEEHLSNEEILTAAECNQTWVAVCERVLFALPHLSPDGLKLTRADVVYQRPVRSSMEVLSALQAAIVPTRKGASWFENGQGQRTGIVLRGGVVVHRAYDKGLESGAVEFLNILRSEEQLRHKAADFSRIYDADKFEFDAAACRDVLNERYLDVAYSGVLDVSPLLAGGRDTLALLSLHPEFISEYKGRVKRNAYNKMRKQVREFRASAIPDDLRVPADAWGVAL